MTGSPVGAAGATVPPLPRGLRLIALAVLAAIGASILAVILVLFWREAGDNLAYWIAGNRLANGLPIYAPPEVAFEPFAYHYPPPLAQAFAPLTLLLPPVWYAIGFRILLLLAVWHLAGRRMLWMLALIAFLPLAYSLRVENVEIFMAVGIVLGLQRWPWLFSIGALVKASPGLGVVYLALQRQWRDVAVATGVGLAIVAVSFVLAPDLWPAWLESISGRAGMVGNSIVPIPYLYRAIAGLGLAVVAGLLGRRRGELLLVAAITVANPGLSLQGFAVLAAWIPIWAAGPEGLAAARAARRSPSLDASAATAAADDSAVQAT